MAAVFQPAPTRLLAPARFFSSSAVATVAAPLERLVNRPHEAQVGLLTSKACVCVCVCCCGHGCVQVGSRHRHRYEPPPTQEEFWDLSFHTPSPTPPNRTSQSPKPSHDHRSPATSQQLKLTPPV
jgi:hypothetical protein